MEGEIVSKSVLKMRSAAWILAREKEGKPTTLKDIRAFWEETFQLNETIFPNGPAYRLLRHWDLRWRKQKDSDIKDYNLAEYVCVEIERYQREIKEVWPDDKGQRVFHSRLFTDETFLREYHRSHFSWFTSDRARLRTKGNGKGRLITIIDAGCAEYGFIPGARQISDPNSPRTDYHKYWTADRYITWFKGLLIALRRYKIGGLYAKFVIIMDNAPTHCTLEDGTVPPSEMKASELTRFCQLHRPEAYKALVNAGTTTTMFTRPLAQKAWAEMRPRTLVQKLAEEGGHRVIYSPKTMSVFNPIEEIWGIAKNDVGRQYDPNAPLQAALANIEPALDKAGEHWAKTIERSDRLLKEATESIRVARAVREADENKAEEEEIDEEDCTDDEDEDEEENDED